MLGLEFIFLLPNLFMQKKAIALLSFFLLATFATAFVLFTSPAQGQQQYNIADINKDGIVDLSDYSILVANFFKTGPGGTPTPTTPPSATNFSATLAPNVTGSSGTGTGSLVYNASDRSAMVNLSFSNLTTTVTGVHIHGPGNGGNDDILFTFPNSSFQNQHIVLTAAQVTSLNTQKLYFNVHTQRNPGGEIRGTINIGTAPSTSPTVSPSPTSNPVGMNSRAMGVWVPNPKFDTCTKEIHDSYKVQGPDGKWYPTWHPHEHTFANGTKCTFGHEHGRDPKLSPLFPKMQEMYFYDANNNGTMDAAEKAAAGVPFAYANEQYDVYNASIGKTNVHRHEDHVGHKVEWDRYNQSYEGPGGASDRHDSDIVCDVAGIIHQGTNSKDAFTNNLHAASGFISCNKNGYEQRITILAAFNKPGQFGEALPCDPRGTQIILGTDSVNVNYPSGDSTSARNVLTRKCVNQFMLVPEGKFSSNTYEDWKASLVLTNKAGKRLNSSPVGGFTVFNPVRFYDPGKPLDVGYLMDLCYETEANGDRMRGGCHVTDYGRITDIKWDDPRSQYRGDMRETYFQADPINNAGGTAIIYTDPLGNNAQSSPFPGSIKQYLTPANINFGQQLGAVLTPSAFGAERGYGTMGGSGKWGYNSVHAPN